MIFSLDVRRARKGDCLLLHWGSRQEPRLAIIDGGPAAVYKPHLRPRLLRIREARGLEENHPLPVDLLMVSHVDDDHIRGILDLTGEIVESVHAPLLRVRSFWHNSFDEIINSDPDELTAAVKDQFGEASLEGSLPEDATLDSEQDEETILASLKVLASVAQGHRLRGDADVLGFPRNPEFDGKLIMAGADEIELAAGLRFVVAGPMQPELLKLQRDHDKWVKEQKEKNRDGGAALAAYVDKSIPNLSSIVVLARVEDKQMLLTGDARGDKILKGLESTGVLQEGGSMHVDLLKVPHHGSANNLDDDFFERITADHYVFSGNGEHGNPEREAMEMLFRARGSEPFHIHLTFPLDEIDVAREADWKKEQQKEKKKEAAGKDVTVREDWSHAKHSLAAFFNAIALAAGQSLHIVPANQPHVIDLLDPLGF